MTMKLWEHWSSMSDGEIWKEMITMLVITMLVGVITGFLTYIKNEYKDKVNESNSKVLKFIFNKIL